MGQIEELEKELASIRYQVNQVQLSLDRATNVLENVKRQQGQVQMSQPVYQQPVQRPVQSQPVYQQPVQPQPVYQQPVQQSVQPQPVYQQPVQQTMQQQTAQPQLYVPHKKSTSTESWIGKHLMGVLASVLIFIAFVLFASLIIPYLNDVVKITMMFTVSIGLTAFSYYEHKKRPENTFFTALLACGLGCSYLSVLVTRIHFKVINDLVMYILLLIWGVVVLFMGKRESRLFQVIGNAGLIISTFLGVGLKDSALVLPMLIYLVILGGAFQYNFWKDKIQRMIQSACNVFVIFFYVMVICKNVNVSVPLTIAAVLALVISAGYYAYFLFGSRLLKGANNTFLALGSAITAYSSYYLLGDCINTAEWFDLIVFFVIAIIAQIALLTEQDSGNREIRFFNCFWVTAWLVLAEIATFIEYDKFFNTGALFALLLPVAIYGSLKEKNELRHQSMILAAMMVFIELFGKSSGLFFAAAIVYSVVIFILEGFVINKNTAYKTMYYIYMQICMASFLDTAFFDIFRNFVELRELLVIVPMGIFNAAMIVVKLDSDRENNSNKALLSILNIFNAIGMLVGLSNIVDNDFPVIQGVYIAYTVALACVNLRRHFNNNAKEKLYAGIKFGVILLAALIGYNAEGYVVSVATLAFAILCIFIGFNKTYGAKELRLYGLILSMICVAKFIMIDITYENTVGRAVSFLISGILCFGISAIYNHFEKQGNTVNNEK